MTFYNENIPLVSTVYSDWQSLFLANFEAMDVAFKVNHVSLTDSSKSGNHTIVQLVQQDNDSNLQTNIGELAIFCKSVTGQTDQILMQYEGNAIEFEYTNYQLYDLEQTTSQTQFFTSLPGKILCYFGSVLVPSEPKGRIGSIKLLPAVAKNIITVNFTYTNKSTSTASLITLVKSKDVITNVNLNQFSSKAFTPFYYFILANI